MPAGSPPVTQEEPRRIRATAPTGLVTVSDRQAGFVTPQAHAAAGTTLTGSQVRQSLPLPRIWHRMPLAKPGNSPGKLGAAMTSASLR